jgi:RHS repeat-associated protein
LTAVDFADQTRQTFAYDLQHRLIERIDARGAVSHYTYDYAGRVSQATHPTGETRTLAPTQKIAVPNLAAGEGTPATPASLGQPINTASFTDGRNTTTTFELDGLDRIIQQTDALTRTTVIDRDPQGNPIRITRPNGAVTTMTYDLKGNLLTSTEQAIAATTTFTYEPTFNQVTSIKDPLNHTTTITYDPKGNPLTITDADNKITTFTYDSRGLLLTSKDALNQTTTFTYDALGRLLTTTDPLNRTTTLTYDAAGNVATSQDALTRTTTFEYDTMNRLKTVTDPAGGVTQYTYDANGNLLTVKDAKNQVTTFVYDSRNRLITTTDPLGKSETYEYDATDNVTKRITPKLDEIVFAYDPVNQLLSKTLPGNLVTSYTYDQVGNLLNVTDPDSALTMTYDLANRLLTTSTTGSPNQPSATLTFTYDKAGNRLTLNDGTSSQTYGYDPLNRLTSLTNSAGSFTLAYDALSRRTSLTLPNGTQTTYTYDPASQVTQVLHQLTATSTQINQAAYAYNGVGNRTSLTDRRGVQSFAYDNLDRLTSATHPLPPTSQIFAYDVVGNRTSGGSVVNAGNQLTEDAQFVYEYDANGSQIKKTNKSTNNFTVYTYDTENRLIKVEDFAAGNPTAVATSTYRYDGLGRRIEKVTPSETRRYVYDGEDILLEYNETNTLLARYTHGPGFDEPFAMTRGGSTYFYHQDGLASVTEITDSAGITARSYGYDVWGNLLEQTGTVENPYTYTGRELDAESGLSYYRARSYNPTIGRFLSKDPAGLGKGTSPYLYVDGNPATLIDPDGLQAVPYPIPGPPLPFPLPPIAIPGSPENQRAAQATNEALQQLRDAFQRQIDKLRKGRWTCTAQCNVQSIGKGCCPDRVFGTASGPSEEIACREAKRAAVRSTPEGCYARHCKCVCQKN